VVRVVEMPDWVIAELPLLGSDIFAEQILVSEGKQFGRSTPALSGWSDAISAQEREIRSGIT
jgi:hypothetical protein